jgi:hypothetical protein
MKTLLILILLALLAGGASLSRPNEESFKKMIREKMAAEKKPDLLHLILGGGKSKADAFLAGCRFQDRLLWTEVERDGRRVYTGAFSKWFEATPAAGETGSK